MSDVISPETLYLEYRDKVERYIKSHVANEQDREDLVSRVFLNAIAALDSYDPSRAAPGTWLYAITRNAVASFYREKNREPELIEIQELSFPSEAEEQIFTNETLEELANALEQLSQRERSIIILRFYHGLSAKETAEKVGVSYANVRFLQHSALKKLRQALKDKELF